ncbi:hypothetical protein [Rubinisphaera margarita]|uniref:hypothetical protein n=1 Tax=Rubinisphaera margarita TaxID=2909586 RepID=UPI001EE83A18|nr:hypothetical protein [Rubinisphaera margarita]MCG6157958.1 hypothetical protein [Rubinisphaera margarita]
MKRIFLPHFLPFDSLDGFKKRLVFSMLTLCALTSPGSAQDSPPELPAAVDVDQEAEELQKRRDIAVALNYCRASFHRIRKYPTQQVMDEEQEKILNNLNLSGIKNPEIIRLYTEVLDEIGQMQLSEKETELFDVKYKRSLRQELAFDSLAVGLDLLTAQYIGAVRTGAASWWDYRNFKWTRDNEVFKLEKARVNSVVQKSSHFLDTFWKLCQEHQIPDRWLVRSTDLDQLEIAMNEPNPEVRLRILQRMEPFMECYPPYWYYLARSHQATGELVASLRDYGQLEHLGTHHFRRDDMLASAFANQAVIQSYLNEGDAVQTARNALSYSTDVWEANLACARILQRAGDLAAAEDAILRNLDVGLEEEQSTVTLLTFYHDTGNNTQLARRLSDSKTLAHVPPPVLIRFASQLSEEETPPIVWTALASSVRIYPQLGFGNDDVIMACHPVWRIDRSKLALVRDDGSKVAGEYTRHGDIDVVRFPKVADFGGYVTGPSAFPQLKLDLQYGDANPIQLAFSDETQSEEGLSPTSVAARNTSDPRSYHLVSAQWGDRNIAVIRDYPRTAAIYQPVRSFATAAAIGSKAADEVKSAEQKEQQPADGDDTTIR